MSKNLRRVREIQTNAKKHVMQNYVSYKSYLQITNTKPTPIKPHFHQSKIYDLINRQSTQKRLRFCEQLTVDNRSLRRIGNESEIKTRFNI